MRSRLLLWATRLESPKLFRGCESSNIAKATSVTGLLRPTRPFMVGGLPGELKRQLSYCKRLRKLRSATLWKIRSYREVYFSSFETRIVLESGSLRRQR